MPDDSHLIEGLKRRDSAVLAALFDDYADKIYRLAANLLHDEQQADGVVQNTFLALITHADGFEGRSSIGTWLYRVGYNECMMRVRSARPQLELDALDEPDVMPSQIVDWSGVPESVIDSEEASDQMERAIRSLKPDLRSVFILRDVEELSTSEVAQILNLTEANVKVRLHRARLALRESLSGYFAERVSQR
ncbi:MAG TPA: sigma-70 family RNA polymerase sigma factor [Aggregatilineales bacterium]|nr:sigma-70 family RNA polymerase sigma factor [Aggregatilineales bacterium]